MRLELAVPKKFIEATGLVRARIESEFEKNDRLKWLFLACFLVLYLAFLLFLSGQATTAQSDYTAARNQLERTRTQADETGWPQKADEAESLLTGLENRFWPGETPGIAEAGFERWIRQTLEGHGIEVRQVQLIRGPAIEDETDRARASLASIQRVRAKVIGPLNEAALLRFLDDAASNSAWVIVDQLIIRSGRNPRFEIDLATFLRSETGN